MVILEELADQVLIALRKIIRAIDLHSRQLIKIYGLTVPQIIVLKDIEQRGSPTVGEIANSVSLSQATITNILIRLEQRGYVTRTQHDGDKRRVVVKTTEMGKAIIARAPSLLHDKFVSSFRNLQDWEQLSIISSLMHVAKMMDATDIDASPFLAVSSEISADPGNTHNEKSV
ncbi:MarR family winged helix-turn-helix transcriptional regulator [Calditrichota bacterium]